MPMSQAIKCITYYEKPLWRDLGSSGDGVSTIGPVTEWMDDTKPNGKNPALVGFICGKEYIAWSSKTTEERRKAVCEHYAALYNLPELKNSIDYVEYDWTADEFSQGTYCVM